MADLAGVLVPPFPRARRRTAHRVNWIGLAVFALFLATWEVLVRTGAIAFDYVPAPTGALSGLRELQAEGRLVPDTAHTIRATLVGWALASLVGVPLGTALGLLPGLWRWTKASLEALRAVPMVAFVPVSVLLFGFTTTTEVAVGAYAALWPVLLNTIGGLRSVHPRSLEVARVLHLGRIETLWKVQLPAAAPSIVVGLRLSLGMALILTLITEMVGNPDGIGDGLVQAGQSLQPEQMFAYILVIGAIGIVLNALLVTAARLGLPGGAGRRGPRSP